MPNPVTSKVNRYLAKAQSIKGPGQRQARPRLPAVSFASVPSRCPSSAPLLNALKITDYRARGFAVGITSHGIGTARAFQVNETAGTFAGVGMGANALATAILVPLLLTLF